MPGVGHQDQTPEPDGYGLAARRRPGCSQGANAGRGEECSQGRPGVLRGQVRRFLAVEGRSVGGLAARLNLYALRHTCATLLLLAGVNPKVVAERLGNCSVNMTLNVYSYVLPSMQEQAADIMGRWLSPPPPKPTKMPRASTRG